MSFSQEVKQELSQQTASARHCNLAELAAVFSMSGEVRMPEAASAKGRAEKLSFEERQLAESAAEERDVRTDLDASKKSAADKTGCQIQIRTENITVARKSFTLLKKTFNICSNVSVQIHRGEKGRGRVYTVSVSDPVAAGQVLRALKLTPGAETTDALLVQQPCCRRAYIRGAFLCAGSISNPEKSYHFEIVCPSEGYAAQLQALIRAFGPDAKIVQRKKHYIVYIKEGAQIVDMLNIMEAHVSLMNLENIRIVREMRNTVNRKVNCEAANINKTVSAAVRQTEDIRYLASVKGLDSIPESLADIAELRLANPDASLKELGEMLVPPVGKSGVNHRLRKLSQLAEEVRQNKEERL